MSSLRRAILSSFGMVLLVITWVGIKYAFSIEDRYLPSPQDVVRALLTINDPNVAVHTASTAGRIVSGMLLGMAVGLGGGIVLFWSRSLGLAFLPAVQALRSVPPIATVPFILIWFGFAESGKLTLVVLGVGLNVLIATYQILSDADEKYLVAFHGFGLTGRELPVSYLLPLAIESLLPTVRFSLSLAFGVVIVSELLGSQVGLGYIIQTSRTTYAMHTIFAAVFILGLLNWTFDFVLRRAWSMIVFWRKRPNGIGA